VNSLLLIVVSPTVGLLWHLLQCSAAPRLMLTRVWAFLLTTLVPLIQFSLFVTAWLSGGRSPEPISVRGVDRPGIHILQLSEGKHHVGCKFRGCDDVQNNLFRFRRKLETSLGKITRYGGSLDISNGSELNLPSRSSPSGFYDICAVKLQLQDDFQCSCGAQNGS
jgi:hypothetical protein